MYFVASCNVGHITMYGAKKKTYKSLINLTEQQTNSDQCNMIRELMDTCFFSDRNCMSAVKEPCPRRQSPNLARDPTTTPVAPCILTDYTVCSIFHGILSKHDDQLRHVVQKVTLLTCFGECPVQNLSRDAVSTKIIP